MAGDKQPKNTFKTYPIGSVQIDIAAVRTLEGQQCLYVAIDHTQMRV